MRHVTQRILEGDAEAFREIVRTYGDSLRLFLAGHVRDTHEAEDLAQEIFVAVYANLSTYNPSMDFEPWFRAIARNKLMSHLRRHYSQKGQAGVLCADIHEGLLWEGGIAELRSVETAARLRECIARHSEDDRHLIQARYFDDEPVNRMAERLRTTVSAISSQLYRIRHQLRACLKGAVRGDAS